MEKLMRQSEEGMYTWLRFGLFRKTTEAKTSHDIVGNLSTVNAGLFSIMI